MADDKAKIFYDQLVEDGYELPKSLETFKSVLGEGDNLVSLYNQLKTDGYELPQYDSFKSIILPGTGTNSKYQEVIEREPVQQQAPTFEGDVDLKASLEASPQQVSGDMIVERPETGPLDKQVLSFSGEEELREKTSELGDIARAERKEYLKSLDTGQSKGSSAANQVAKSVIQGFSEIPSAISILADKADDSAPDWWVEFLEGVEDAEEIKSKNPEDYVTGKFSDWLKEQAEELFPTNPAYQEQFITSIVPAAGGQMLQMFAGGAASKLATKGLQKVILKETSKDLAKSVATGTNLINAMSVQGASQYDEALAASGDRDEAFNVFLMNMALGSSDAWMLSRMFRRIDKATGGGVKQALESTAKQGIENFAEEFSQKIGENLIAKMTYDETRDLFEGAVVEGAAGGLVSMIFTGAGVSLNSIANNKNLSESKRNEAQKKLDLLAEIKAEEATIEGDTRTKDEIKVEKQQEIIDQANDQIEKQVIEEVADTGDDALNAEIDRMAEEAAQVETIPPVEQETEAEAKTETAKEAKSEEVKTEVETKQEAEKVVEEKVVPEEKLTEEKIVEEKPTQEPPPVKKETTKPEKKGEKPAKKPAKKESITADLPIKNESTQDIKVGKKDYQVTKTDEGLAITDKASKKPINKRTKTYKKVLGQYKQDNMESFTKGKEAEKVDEPGAYVENVIESSENPLEIATAYINEPDGEFDYREQAIRDNLIPFKEDSFRRFGDINLVSADPRVRLHYIRKDGKPIDVQAEEISETAGVEITPQDIVDFVEKYPTGTKSAKPLSQNKKRLADRFNSVTGIDLDEGFANEIADYQGKKVDKTKPKAKKEDSKDSLPAEEEVPFQRSSPQELATKRYIDNTVKSLKKAFPNVDVSTDAKEIDKIISQLPESRKKQVQEGRKPLGFTYQGKVYIDPRRAKKDTPIHEFGHIWNMYAKKEMPSVFKRGLNLIKGTEYESRVRKNEAYKDLSEEAILEEALAMAIGEKGVSIENKRKSAQFREWLNELWRKIKTALNVKGMSSKELQDLTLEKYTDLVAGKLLSGEEISSISSDELAGRFIEDLQAQNLIEETDQTETEAFKKWSGGGEIIEHGEISNHRFDPGKPTIIKAYHGTTHGDKLNIFKGEEVGNKEGQFGAVNYFTSSYSDAQQNYLEGGPDLTQRIDLEKERVEQELQDMDDIDEIKDQYPDLSKDHIKLIEEGEYEDVAVALAEKALKGQDSRVLEVYLRTDNPIVIGGKNETWVELLGEEDLSEFIDEARDEIIEENDLEESDLEDYEFEIQDRAKEKFWDNGYEIEQETPFMDAVEKVSYEFSNFDPSALFEIVSDFYDGAKAGKLEEALRKHEGLIYVEGDDGGLVSSHIIGQIFKELGYDAIILNDANKRFENMDMEYDTSHIHVFDKDQAKIKSATDNVGTFDPENPDIRFQAPEEGQYSTRGNYKDILDRFKKLVEDYSKVIKTKRNFDAAVSRINQHFKDKGIPSLRLAKEDTDKIWKERFADTASLIKKREKAVKNVERNKFAMETPTVRKILSVPLEDIPLSLIEDYNTVLENLGQRGEIDFNRRELSQFEKKLSDSIEKEIEKAGERKGVKDDSKGDDSKKIMIKEGLVDLNSKRQKSLRYDPKNFTKDEKNIIRELKNISPEEMKGLTNADLKRLHVVFNKIENGWLSNRAYNDYVRKARQARSAKTIQKGYDLMKPSEINAEKAREDIQKSIDEALGLEPKNIKDREKIFKKISKLPLFKIDEALNGEKTRAFYEKLIKPISGAMERAQRGYKNTLEETDKLIDNIKRDLFDSSVLMEMYSRQLEHESDGKQGNVVEKYVAKLKDGTYDLDSRKRIAELYQSVPKTKDGNIDMEAFWNNLEEAEQDFIKYVNKTNKEELLPISKHSEVHYRGGSYVEHNNYSHIFSDAATDKDASDIVDDLTSNSVGKNIRSAKSAPTYARQGGIRPIRFDFISAFRKGVKSTHLDYNLTPALKEVFGTLDYMKSREKDTQSGEIIKGIDKAVRKAVEIDYASTRMDVSLGDRLLNVVLRNSYNSILSSLQRIPSEMTSNLAGAFIYDPGTITSGVKYLKGKNTYNDLYDYVGTVHASRLGRNTEDLKKIFEQDKYGRTQKAKRGAGERTVSFFENNWAQKTSSSLNKFIIGMSDAAVSRPYWLGKFHNEFKKLTGEEFNNDKFRNTQAYKDKYGEQIQQAGTEADYQTSIMLNTGSSFEGALAAKSRTKDGRMSLTRSINNFVRGFALNEYSSFVNGLKSAVGKGTLDSRSKGAKLAAAILVRQMVYSTVIGLAYQAIMYPLLDDEEKREADEEFERLGTPEQLARTTTGGLLTLAVSKWGNIAKFSAAAGVELMNRYLTEKDGKEYDKFRDGLMYMPVGDIEKTRDVAKIMGVYSSPVTTSLDAIDYYSKLADKLMKGEELTEEELINYEHLRVGLGITNMALGVPLYKNMNQALKKVARKEKEEQKRREEIRERRR